MLRNSFSGNERVPSSAALPNVWSVLARNLLSIVQDRCDKTSSHGSLRLYVSLHTWLTLYESLRHLLLILLLRHLVEILLLLHVKVRIIVLVILANWNNALRQLRPVVGLPLILTSIIISDVLLLVLSTHCSLSLTCCCLSMLDLFSLRPISIHVVLIVDY